MFPYFVFLRCFLFSYGDHDSVFFSFSFTLTIQRIKSIFGFKGEHFSFPFTPLFDHCQFDFMVLIFNQNTKKTQFFLLFHKKKHAFSFVSSYNWNGKPNYSNISANIYTNSHNECNYQLNFLKHWQTTTTWNKINNRNTFFLLRKNSYSVSINFTSPFLINTHCSQQLQELGFFKSA